MVMLRFPFSFPQPGNQPNVISKATTTGSHSFSAAAAVAFAAGAATFAGISAVKNLRDSNSSVVENALNSIFSGGRSSLPWGTLSLVDGSASSSVVESKTGESFPAVISGNRQLLGIGLRRKTLLGLKNIDVYAFGVYADKEEVQKCLDKKLATLSASELKQELLEADVCLTVRLQIVYGKLSIRSVRNAFEDSVGSRLQKFGGPDNNEVLQRFTSLFKDEYKIPRGSVIELSRERGHVLRTTIEGKDVGSIESKALCRSIFDLYIGEEPFDKQAKEEVENTLIIGVAIGDKYSETCSPLAPALAAIVRRSVDIKGDATKVAFVSGHSNLTIRDSIIRAIPSVLQLIKRADNGIAHCVARMALNYLIEMLSVILTSWVD